MGNSGFGLHSIEQRCISLRRHAITVAPVNQRLLKILFDLLVLGHKLCLASRLKEQAWHISRATLEQSSNGPIALLSHGTSVLLPHLGMPRY